MRNRVRHCILCRSDDISNTVENERTIRCRCRTCGATVRIEFDPPDQPGLRGRIELLEEPRHRRDETDVSHPNGSSVSANKRS